MTAHPKRPRAPTSSPRVPRINSRFRSLEAHTEGITAPPPRHYPVTESVALPPIRGKHHAPVSTPIVHHSIRCNWAPRLSEVQGPYHARQHRASTRPGRRLAYV